MVDEDDLVALGGRLESGVLIEAYRVGVFPWPVEGIAHLPWFCPKERGVLLFKDLNVPKRLERKRRQSPYEFSIDRAFKRVIEACRFVPRPDGGTWITEEMQKAYVELHELGYAHSVEAWQDGQLVGGLYGVCVDGCFAGESMFHFKADASKLALLFLIDYLKGQGLEWMDIQMLTPHMEKLGAKLMDRASFLALLRETQKRALRPFEPKARTQS